MLSMPSTCTGHFLFSRYMKFPEKNIQITTGEHLYTDLGNAEETLLLMHGFAFRPGLYPLAERLQSRFRVVIPDLPFASKNGSFPAHTLQSYVDFLLEFVHTLGLEKVSIFGNSLGGTLALLCDLAAPGRFKNLIVRSPLWSRRQLPWYLRIAPLTKAHAHFSRYEVYARWGLERFYQISARISSEIEKEGKRIVPYHSDEISPSVLSGFLAELPQVEFADKLKEIRAKTLIVWGEKDTFIPSHWGAHLESLLPNGCFLEMAGEYHNIATVNADGLAKEIISFVRGVE
jgi:pimeloyl-ACP methyl ester carboxylesterase